MPESPQGLALLDRANRLLEQARSLEDLKSVRDAAEAARTFAKAAQLGLELQNRAAELKLRAERKAGAFLSGLGLHGGDRRSKTRNVSLNLDDLGIKKHQSRRWQMAASVPDADFERFLQSKNQVGEEITGASLLHLAKTLRRHRPAQPTSLKSRAPKRLSAAADPPSEWQELVGELIAQQDQLWRLLEPICGDSAISLRPEERRYLRRLTADIRDALAGLAALYPSETARD
ncbi:MAG: hypothetical protein KDA44_02545 [Planctomycetales bacterium]|nr:hypothetical protein [Planctomycetales bacterium]